MDNMTVSTPLKTYYPFNPPSAVSEKPAEVEGGTTPAYRNDGKGLTAPTVKMIRNADLLCGEIATHAESLKKIVGRLQAQHDGFPCIPVIYKWIRENTGFANQYRACKADQADLFVDEMVDIADDETGDEIGSVAVQRSKLRIWARQWVASKLRPKVYGDRIIAEHTGLLNLAAMSDADLIRIANEQTGQPLLIEGEMV